MSLYDLRSSFAATLFNSSVVRFHVFAFVEIWNAVNYRISLATHSSIGFPDFLQCFLIESTESFREKTHTEP